MADDPCAARKLLMLGYSYRSRNAYVKYRASSIGGGNSGKICRALLVVAWKGASALLNIL